MEYVRELNPGISFNLYASIKKRMQHVQPIKIEGSWHFKIGKCLYRPIEENSFFMTEKAKEEINGEVKIIIKSREIINFIKEEDPNGNEIHYIVIAHTDTSMPEITQISYFRTDGTVFKREGRYKNVDKNFLIDENGNFFKEDKICVLKSYPTSWEKKSISRAISIGIFRMQGLHNEQLPNANKEKESQGPQVIDISKRR